MANNALTSRYNLLKDKGLCVKCGKYKAISGQTRCRRHAALDNFAAIRRTANRREKSQCVECGEALDCESTRFCHKHLIKERTRKNNKYTELRIEALNHYGSSCYCCGESNRLFLTMDHINGGGRQHRNEMGGNYIYRWLKQNSYPSGFRTACFNCNSGRARNNGICPHQTR